MKKLKTTISEQIIATTVVSSISFSVSLFNKKNRY